MRRSAGVVVAIATVVLTPAVAGAENGYEAAWVGQTPANGTVIESGEVLDATMTLRNLGPKTWTRPLAQLGPAGASVAERDRASVFQADSWLAPNRITAMEQERVGPTEEATFRFQLKGPPATAPVARREVVAPLHDPPADGTGGGWMDGSTTGGIPFGGLYYDLEVRPSEPPTVTIDSAPAAVTAGQGLPVGATAADNVRVAFVAARIDRGPVTQLTGEPAAGTLPTAGIPAGQHTLTVAAADGAGNVGVATAPLTVADDTGVPNGTPAGAASLTAGLTAERRARLTTRAGRKVSVGGRLRVQGTKDPIAGARLTIEARARGARSWRTVTTVATDRLGRYQTRVAAGPSRTLRVVYKALTLQPAPTATRRLSLDARAKVGLRVARRGRTVRMTGRVPAAPFPQGGVLVSLQGKQAGDKWRPFLNVRAKGRQRRFGGTYRFGGGGRFKLRAVVNEQPGYPYARGVSPARGVTVR